MSLPLQEPQGRTELGDSIAEFMRQHHIGAWGITDADIDSTLALQRFRWWLDQGLHGQLDWLSTNPHDRFNLTHRFEQARSVIVMLTPYDHATDATEAGVTAHISRYAHGRDYHNVMRKPLRRMRTLLQEAGATWTYSSVDAGPVSEKSYAVAAGLGWLGRHSNLIHRQLGSYCFLSLIASDIPVEAIAIVPSPQVPDACGTCTACVDSCPTDAIHAGFVITERCISYDTIELPRLSQQSSAHSPDSGLDNRQWIHGCDDCQEVCPWVGYSRRQLGYVGWADFGIDKRWQECSLDSMAARDDAGLAELIQGTPLNRERVQGIRRNIAKVRPKH